MFASKGDMTAKQQKVAKFGWQLKYRETDMQHFQAQVQKFE